MHSPFAFFTLHQNMKIEDLVLNYVKLAIEEEWKISIP